MKNLHIVKSTKLADIIAKFKELEAKAAHFTNGTYAFSAKMSVPTTLAGFKRVTRVDAHLPIVVAVNSDKSMEELNKKDFEREEVRAKKVAEPLALAFPNTPVIIIFYDEATPNALYEALAKQGLTRTLHKWGYGTNPDAPKIEGAEQFERVYGFPLPNDIKPVCYDDTPRADEPQKVTVEKLSDLVSKDGVKFALPDELAEYQDPAWRAEQKAKDAVEDESAVATAGAQEAANHDKDSIQDAAIVIGDGLKAADDELAKLQM